MERARRKSVKKLQKFTRYPVWPAWNGVFIWLMGLLLGNDVASELEHWLTGRVCPNFFSDNNNDADPFLMLVHHCHSFAPWDPLRWFQRTWILPEGFPAHPHRGFITLTYFLQGGFRHRDSLGIEQYYGVEGGVGGTDHDTPHSQWLNTGSGLLHEEMFHFRDKHVWNWLVPQRQELYQLWINLPASQKMLPPTTFLLSDEQDTPVVILGDNNAGQAQIRVLAGTYGTENGVSYTATTPIVTEMLILHVTLDPNVTWTCPIPTTLDTCLLYVRRGSLTCFYDTEDGGEDSSSSIVIPPHHTAYFSTLGTRLQVQALKQADFMLLAGVPLREPCVAQGSMVMNTAREIQQAYQDYQAGLFGYPWDHSLTREQWKEHLHTTSPVLNNLEKKTL